MARTLLPTNCTPRDPGELTMTLRVTDFHPQSDWLYISEEIERQAREFSESFPSSVRPRLYLNSLARSILLAYFQAEFPNASAEPDGETFWCLGINGSAITLGDRRAIIVPSEAFDIEELEICREWVDIPELAGDYYLAVQLDMEEKLARVWGYTTRQKLQELGAYNQRVRCYSLRRDEVTEDIDSLSLIRHYYPNESTRGEVASLPKLSLDRLTELFDILGNPELTFPRRAVSFEEWGAIIANRNWREMLIDRRFPKREPERVHLGEWFENQFARGWRAIEEVISPRLVPAFKNIEIKRAKDINLELSRNQLALTLTIGRTEFGFKIQTSVYPTGEQTFLPPNVKLMILTEEGEIFKEVVSEENDEFIRYRFDAESGDKFQVKIALGEESILEKFQV
ncbi:DUF1822 family protein [Pannus brasiliensis CCIBt3594]|uniref:DUF1822 family protein n=1 Tax=Pannus brasiliensis CCIBt3594 TaxID=1427578 RepID=A0AAW9QR78_9CHRO